MKQVDPEALSATNHLHDLTRDWIEHLRSVLYHARVVSISPLAGEEHPLSEDYPFVRRVIKQGFPRFHTRPHFDIQPPLQPGQQITYSVTLEYHPGTQEYDTYWSFACGSYVLGKLTLAPHLWRHNTDMSWLSADRFLLTMLLSVNSKRPLRLTSRVWELQGNPPVETIISNLELFEVWTEDDSAWNQVIGSRYIQARRCLYVDCGQPLHVHQGQFCSQHDPQLAVV